MAYRDGVAERYNAYDDILEKRQQRIEETTNPPLIEESEQKEKDQPKIKSNLSSDSNDTQAPHIGEGRRIVAGGLTDLWNSVVSIPKFFDKKFYQPSDPLNPYKYEGITSPLLINYNPVMKTQWGKFLRPMVEFGAGFAFTGGAGSLVPGVKGALLTASKTFKGRLVASGATGFIYDLISNESQNGNLTQALIESQPKFSFLKSVATTAEQSPAKKAFLNGFEGIGFGLLGDLGVEGGARFAKSVGIIKPKTKLDKALNDSLEVELKVNDKKVEQGAKKEYELSIVKEQSPIQVFHGTSPEAAKLIRSSGVKFTNKDYGTMGEGFYVTTDEAYSTVYGPEVIEGSLPKSAKILDITDQNAFQWAKKIGIGEPTGVEDIGHIQEHFSYEQKDQIVKWAKDNNYDGIKFDPFPLVMGTERGADQSLVPEIVIFNKNLANKIVKKVDINKPTWDKLTTEQKDLFKQGYADKNNIDWSGGRGPTRRIVNQDKANKELAAQQLEEDLIKGRQRNNPAYTKGGDITDNQALSNSSNSAKAVRDNIKIRNNFSEKYGTPDGVLSEAFIRRIKRVAPNVVTKEVNSLAKALQADPAIQKLYGNESVDAINEDLAEAIVDLAKFINDSGHTRLVEIDVEDVTKYIKSKDLDKPTIIEGIPVLNKSQLIATDTILGQLLYESRDLARGALSIMDQVDISADGSPLDGILARYEAISTLRKSTSMLSSFELRKYKAGKAGAKVPDLDKVLIEEQAATATKDWVASFKKLLKEDADDDLIETFLHFTAVTNGNKQSWKDLTTFFEHRLRGYSKGNKYQRNAIIGELQNMGVSSMLSGPKTPVRALIGTGLGTAMRPAATIIGALGKGDDRTLRGAFSSFGAMLEANNEAWRKAAADFQAYSMYDEGWRGFTQSKSDKEWNAMGTFFEKYGETRDQLGYAVADQLRKLNKMPIFNYGPRTMKAMDTYFTQLIGRARLRQIAFDEVYDAAKVANKNLSDLDLDELIKASEAKFESKVFKKNGQVSDELALFAADEAKLTAELEGNIKKFDALLNQAPIFRPFFLFMKTGVNSLKMTSKYTPGLNRIITEHADLRSKAWDDPIMLKYGIKSQRDLELAQTVMEGRVAIGRGFVVTAMFMALNGQITGNGPPDSALRNSWRSINWQPTSLKIGNSRVDISAIEPFSTFFTVAADIMDGQKVMGDQWAGDWLKRLMYLVAQNVTNKSFLAGLLQIQDLFSSELRDAPRVLANFANNQVPWSGLRNEIGKVLSPGMRELESGFWQSVGNRNLWVDAMTPGVMLPYKTNILNGERIRDWDLMTRLINGILPFNINVGTTPTMEWLFRSGVNFKQTFNTGPKGQSLEGHPHTKALFQELMGQENIEAQLKPFFERREIQDSIIQMEKDRAAGKTYEPHKTQHGDDLRRILLQAKENAWKKVLKTDVQAQIINREHLTKKRADKFRIIGGPKQKELKQVEKDLDKFMEKTKAK